MLQEAIETNDRSSRPPLSPHPNAPPVHPVALKVAPRQTLEYPPPSRTGTIVCALVSWPDKQLEVGMTVDIFSGPELGENPSVAPGGISHLVRGVVAGERSRTLTEVELVVRSINPRAPIQRAFVLFRFSPGSLPLPNLGGLVAQRFSAKKRMEHAESTPSALPPLGPRARTFRQILPAREPRPRSPSPPPKIPDRQRRRMGPMAPHIPVTDPSHSTGPGQARSTAAAPYSIWEKYGGEIMSRERRAEMDAIRNYGCPIRVGLGAQWGEGRRTPGVEWRYPEEKVDADQHMELPTEWNQGEWM